MEKSHPPSFYPSSLTSPSQSPALTCPGVGPKIASRQVLNPMEDAPGQSEDREKQTATQPCLQWRDLDGRQQFFALAEEEVVVGRKADAQIVLDNQYISRHHAKIIKTEK